MMMSNAPYLVRFVRTGRVHYVHCENAGTASIVAHALRNNPNNADVQIWHGLKLMAA
jgi:hypothetical protein